VRRPALYINRDLEYDWLIALEFGRVVDGQPEDHLRRVGEDFAYVLDVPGGEVLGFGVGDLTSFDVEAEPELWKGPHFDAPLFGLRDVPAAAVVLAAQARLRHESTTNRAIFGLATHAQGEKALSLWIQCLEAGDSMAHYGLGYTLLELGRPREAYGHLRAYTELCPWNAWAWCWLGRAHEALGEPTDARAAYRRAVALDPEETDAPELLTALGEES
jgi:tetratricopeptide (TPR) repeat protein